MNPAPPAPPAPAAPPIPPPDRSLLPIGLRRLILLRYKATIRRMLFGSGKRRIYTLVGLALMGLYLFPRLLTRTGQKPLNPDGVRLWFPAILLLIILPQVLFRTRRDPMAFQPAELDLVVPGPFSRRQLVLYQIASHVGPLILMGLWMGVFIRAGTSYLSTALAAALTGQLINLLTCNAAALTGLLAARARWALPALLCGIAAIGYSAVRAMPPFPRGDASKITEWAASVRHTPVIDALFSPLTPYIETLLAPSFPAALPWAAAALAINIGLIVLFVALDRSEVEALVLRSQKQMEQVQQRRRGGVRIANPRRAAAIRIRPLPRWGGAGPLLWRQLTTVYRGGGPIWSAALAIGLLGGAAWYGRWIEASHLTTIMIAVSAAATFLLPMFLRCDFRDDLDHMATLKGLPFAPFAVVVGQVAAPLALVALVNSLLLAGLLCTSGDPRHALLAVGIVACGALLAAALLAIENTIFLLAPMRPYSQAVSAGFDPSLVGRHFLVTLVKLLAFAGAAIVIGGPVALVLWLGGGRIAAGTVGLAGAVVILWLLLLACTAAFRAFDVAADQPA